METVFIIIAIAVAAYFVYRLMFSNKAEGQAEVDNSYNEYGNYTPDQEPIDEATIVSDFDENQTPPVETPIESTVPEEPRNPAAPEGNKYVI